jgi:DNA-binding NarL/FixJ family response regulator
LHAIEVIAAGDALISPKISRRLIAEFAARRDPQAPHPQLAELTDRERHILLLSPAASATPRSPAGS